MSFMIETSARHIHLTQETLEKLFGEGYELTVRKPLSYPGQFASNERLTVVGPKKEMAKCCLTSTAQPSAGKDLPKGGGAGTIESDL